MAGKDRLGAGAGGTESWQTGPWRPGPGPSIKTCSACTFSPAWGLCTRRHSPMCSRPLQLRPAIQLQPLDRPHGRHRMHHSAIYLPRGAHSDFWQHEVALASRNGTASFSKRTSNHYQLLGGEHEKLGQEVPLHAHPQQAVGCQSR